MQRLFSIRVKLTCPPHIPTVYEFWEILNEYRYALLIKFISPAIADEEIAKAPYRTRIDPAMPGETRERAKKFWADCYDHSEKITLSMLELEKIAFNKGYTFAVAFASGACRLREKCNVENGIRLHQNVARIPEHGVVIN